ncbi:TPA: hypothetical protein ACFOIQ_001824 [Neisseria meningitidis]
MKQKIWYTYDDIHRVIKALAEKIRNAGVKYDAMIAIGVAVLHEKIKAKAGKIPEGIPYFSGITVEDWWINYPWDALDIDEHNRLAEAGRG